MATVHVVLAEVQGRASTGMTLPVPSAEESAAATVDSSAVSIVVDGLVATESEVWTITPRDGDVWVRFGKADWLAANPAGPGAGWLLMAGQPRDLDAAEGQSVAIKDA